MKIDPTAPAEQITIAARGMGNQWWYALLFGKGLNRIEVLGDATSPMWRTRDAALKAGLQALKKLRGPAILNLHWFNDGWCWEWWTDAKLCATKPYGFCYTTRRGARRGALRAAERLNLWETV